MTCAQCFEYLYEDHYNGRYSTQILFVYSSIYLSNKRYKYQCIWLVMKKNFDFMQIILWSLPSVTGEGTRTGNKETHDTANRDTNAEVFILTKGPHKFTHRLTKNTHRSPIHHSVLRGTLTTGDGPNRESRRARRVKEKRAGYYLAVPHIDSG